MADKICYQAPKFDGLQDQEGRFGTELARTRDIFFSTSPKSLVILDEIGRGTSTFDGLSLAWAAAHYMGEKIGAFTLFATHYFELTALADELSHCDNVHLDATEHGGQLVFLHAVRPGPANQSRSPAIPAPPGAPVPAWAKSLRHCPNRA